MTDKEQKLQKAEQKRDRKELITQFVLKWFCIVLFTLAGCFLAELLLYVLGGGSAAGFFYARGLTPEAPVLRTLLRIGIVGMCVSCLLIWLGSSKEYKRADGRRRDSFAEPPAESAPSEEPAETQGM